MNVPGRPGFLARVFFRVPVWLYRLGFAGFERGVGLQFVLLTTRGRKSGLPRQTMLDVIDREGQTFYVESAWSERADWVKNLRAEPRAQAQIGRERFPVVARELSSHEGAEHVLRFLDRHPWYARTMFRLIGVPLDLHTGPALRARLEHDALVVALARTSHADSETNDDTVREDGKDAST